MMFPLLLKKMCNGLYFEKMVFPTLDRNDWVPRWPRS